MTTTKTAATRRARRAKPETAPTPRAARTARRRIPSPQACVDPTIPADTAPAKTEPAGKLGLVVGLLRRPEGATVAQISEATDWLPHSVRGAMAGTLKKKHKLSIVSEPAEGGRVYRLAEPT